MNPEIETTDTQKTRLSELLSAEVAEHYAKTELHENSQHADSQPQEETKETKDDQEAKNDEDGGQEFLTNSFNLMSHERRTIAPGRTTSCFRWVKHL